LHIKELKIKQFRNYNIETIFPINGINVFYGENAHGKTNIVEAIYFLSTGKSFRTKNDTDLIKFECDYAYIKIGYKTLAGNNTEEAMIKKDGKKSFNINYMPIKRLGDLFGNFSCIAFTPEDIKAIKESPALRRKIIDVEISKIRKTYYFELKNYYRILSEKNKLLKAAINKQNRDLLFVYNEQLAKAVKKIISYRSAFIDQIKDDFEKIYRYLSGEEKKAHIIYKPCIEAQDIEQHFLEKVNANMQKEIDYKISLFGPHKEDFAFMLDEKEAKKFCSQGQQRTLMLAYKLAVLNIFKNKTNENPVLVLDDVFSELDYNRQKNVCTLLKDTQVFITTAVKLNIEADYKLFTIKDAKISEN
jgi:DNA replication and repair protein RecF